MNYLFYKPVNLVNFSSYYLLGTNFCRNKTLYTKICLVLGSDDEEEAEDRISDGQNTEAGEEAEEEAEVEEEDEEVEEIQKVEAKKRFQSNNNYNRSKTSHHSDDESDLSDLSD